MKISLAAQHIGKRYGGVTALSDGSLDVQSGEVLALMGANGSGKSTLSKIITGVVAPDQGQLLLDGKPISFASPQAARNYSIAAVYQELSLIPDMTVAENIWLAHELSTGFLRRRDMRMRTQELLDLFAGTVAASLRPNTQVSTLPPDERQIIEILKALSLQPRIMLLDEATASLDSRQVGRLFELIAQWKSQDMAIVFVSHRMDEIFRIADRATVLRSGKTVASTSIAETNQQALVGLMIESTEVARHIKHKEQAASSNASVCLTVEHLSTPILHNINFTLHTGELLGLGGLRGQGQSDLLLALFGAIAYKGNITLSAKPVHFTHPGQAMRERVAFVPGDRGSQGLLTVRSIFENLQLPSWQRYGPFLQLNKARQDASTVANKLHLVMESLNAPVSSLSGGNAQKVVLGKWLLRDPLILLLDDPTKGVDVGAKEEFYALLAELRETGTAILLYSSDDEELLGLSDRVLVLHDGQIQAELVADTLTRSELVAASMGTAQTAQGNGKTV